MSFKVDKKESFKIFDDIARKYDPINSILSLGLHRRWRKHFLENLPPRTDNIQVLDLATGTGDVALALVRDQRVAQVQGLDLSVGMLRVGQQKVSRAGLQSKVFFTAGDAEQIPFPQERFHMVTMAFGIRNVNSVHRCLQDCHRILKKNGRLVFLEFSMPENRIIRRLHLFYLRKILPVIGRMLSGHQYAYSYLNKTIESFPYGQSFVSLIEKTGFKNAGFKSLSFGIVNLYWGEKK